MDIIKVKIKNIIMKYIAALLVSFALVSPALAQTNSSSLQVKAKEAQAQAQKEIKDAKEALKSKVQNVKEKEKAVEEDLKTKVQQEKRALVGSSTTFLMEQFKAFETKRAAVQKEIEDGQKSLQNTIEKQREGAKKEIETLKVQLDKKLKGIKDEQKKTAVENVFDQLNKVKDTWIDNFKKSTDQIEKVAGNILSRADKAAANGKDITAVMAQLTTAKTAIAQARSLIEIEAGKTYSVTVGAEANLKSDVTKSRDALKQDLEKIQQSIKSARDAVQQAAVTLAKIPNVNKLEVASSTTSAPASTSTAQ
ncbi:MAG: hypothetical protein Q7R98_03065 [Candidatus Jorgensenbacteria bacterium]|nr:hypothetical protein [Candidatus Jorgensenbacteria bacterium]